MAVNSNNYETDYDDKRLTEVKAEGQETLNEVEETYGGMISGADQHYEDLKQNAQDWADKQSAIQQEKTDFTIEKIEQEKEKAHKDYLKEQSGAYVDWQKQSNQYGAEAEKMAASGLTNTGFSESSQVSMYNTYQNRVATARESYQYAVLNYNNAIKDAMLQNNAILAEIAQTALKTQLDLSLEGFQYKNQLITEKLNTKIEVKNTNWQHQMDMLNQINTENKLKADIDMYNDNQKWQTDENQKDRDHDKTMADIEHKYQLERDKINNDFAAKQNELDRKHDKEMESIKDANARKQAEEQHKRDKELLAIEQKNKLAQLDKQLANDKAYASYTNSLTSGSSGGGTKITGGGSSGGSSSSGSSSGSKISGGSKTYAVNTAYYKGSLNSDAKKYGTFSNGYQPKGISGHGTLKKTGDTVTFKTQTLSGQKQTVTQNIWKAEDGTKWYWEGRQNKYIQVK